MVETEQERIVREAMYHYYGRDPDALERLVRKLVQSNQNHSEGCAPASAYPIPGLEGRKVT